MNAVRHFIVSICAGSIALAAAGAAQAQSLTGTWNAVITEISNTCAAPPGDPDMSVVELLQVGDLLESDFGTPEQTLLSGVVTGSSLAIGFEEFDFGGVTIYDPAENVLTIDGSRTSIAGNLHWEFYEPFDCSGSQSWSGVKSSAGTPGDLSGSWTVTSTDLTDTCDVVDPTPVPFPVTIQQEGSLVRVTSAVDFGQTRIAGNVSGSTLRLGLGIREPGGDFTVYDAAENSFAIAPGFASFSGVTLWRSYEAQTCTGTDSVSLTLPEPGAIGAAAAVIAALSRVRRRRDARAERD